MGVWVFIVALSRGESLSHTASVNGRQTAIAEIAELMSLLAVTHQMDVIFPCGGAAGYRLISLWYKENTEIPMRRS